MRTIAIIALYAIVCSSASQANIVMDTVPVGDSGNAEDTRYASGGLTGFGRVDYTYHIGKYEVTNWQYANFLNCVDPSGQDPHGLYSSDMGSSEFGGISYDPAGGSGSMYTIRPGRGNKPVNFVSWYDTLRFANWLHNGQGDGNTEDGAYDMGLGSEVVRKPGARAFLPSENEWYKAAFYKGGGTDAGYWNFPMQSDEYPIAELPPGTNNSHGSANYSNIVGDLTDVGSYTTIPSDGPYGTFDQGGNAHEWTEVRIDVWRGVRGGSFDTSYPSLFAAARQDKFLPVQERNSVGFRVAFVPEPTSFMLLLLGGYTLLKYSW